MKIVNRFGLIQNRFKIKLKRSETIFVSAGNNKGFAVIHNFVISAFRKIDGIILREEISVMMSHFAL